ncbi:MAG: EutN/CcmL family microcompartment protein [Myxococcales bacterium]|nr:EutN/CcmL family microcompartment protein [Myxococcales bacterium]
MYLGRVIGSVVARRKVAGLEGAKFLVVQPLDDRLDESGPFQVAVDTVQAGPGDLVYLVGSREAALALDPYFVPVDAAIIGIVDRMHRPERGDDEQNWTP